MSQSAMPGSPIALKSLGLPEESACTILSLVDAIDKPCSARSSKLQKLDFKGDFAITKSARELKKYVEITNCLKPHVVSHTDTIEVVPGKCLYPVIAKLNSWTKLLYVDASFTYHDIVILASGGEPQDESDFILPFGDSFARADATCLGGLSHDEIGSSCASSSATAELQDYIGSVVLAGVRAALSEEQGIAFPLKVDFSAADQKIYCGSTLACIPLANLGPSFAAIGAGTKLYYARRTALAQFGERRDATISPLEAADVEISGPEGFHMRVHVPAHCVKEPTTLTVCFPDLGTAPKNEWIFQPFRIYFESGVQPMQPVELYMSTPRNVQHERLELFRSAEADFFPPVELLRRLPNRSGHKVGAAYFDIEDPKNIFMEIDHFSIFEFSLGQRLVRFDAGAVEENIDFSRGYDKPEQWDVRWPRGGQDYFLPAKFWRTALQIGDFTPFEDWPVGFHGTADLAVARSIIQDGFRLPAAVRDGHIPRGTVVRGVPDWAHAVFLSRSHKYAMRYGKVVREPRDGRVYVRTGAVDDRNQVIFCLLQCRMRPQSFLVTPTTMHPRNNDRRVPDAVIEYRVPDPQNVKPYGILLRGVPLGEVQGVLDSPYIM